MKLRMGFVSNSSSSSFICDITGNVESGMDLSLEDAGMVECVNGHTFGEDFLLGTLDDIVEELGKEPRDYELDAYALRFEIPEKYCPICQLQKMTKDDMLKYLLKKTHLIEADVISEVAETFKSYKELKEHLKQN